MSPTQSAAPQWAASQPAAPWWDTGTCGDRCSQHLKRSTSSSKKVNWCFLVVLFCFLIVVSLRVFYPWGNWDAPICCPGASTWQTTKCLVISCMSSLLKKLLKHSLSAAPQQEGRKWVEGRGDGTEGWTKKEGVRGWRDGEQTLDLDPTQRGTHRRPSGQVVLGQNQKVPTTTLG